MSALRSERVPTHATTAKETFLHKPESEGLLARALEGMSMIVLRFLEDGPR